MPTKLYYGDNVELEFYQSESHVANPATILVIRPHGTRLWYSYYEALNGQSIHPDEDPAKVAAQLGAVIDDTQVWKNPGGYSFGLIRCRPREIT